MATTRIQRKRTKGWKMPENTVYVGRPTIWGNPFIHPNPQEAVDAFKQLISKTSLVSFSIESGGLQFARNHHKLALHWAYSEWLHDNIHLLKGKNLACWCPLDQPCHADTLLQIARNEDKGQTNDT